MMALLLFPLNVIKPLSIRKFQYFLDNQLPKEVFRGKGFLWFEDSEFKHIFHLVAQDLLLTINNGKHRLKIN